jgi:hypothetical protein
MSFRVELLARTEVVTVSEDALAIVPATDVALVISGVREPFFRLDGRRRRFAAAGSSWLLTLDLTRSTGIHRLEVPPGHVFWFASEDAKLRLDGLEAMLRYLRNEGLAWTGQLLFSDGSYLRDPHMVYGWLDQHTDRLLAAAEAVAAAPRRGTQRDEHVTASGGQRLALQPTMALLRRRGAELLEAHSAGPLTAFGRQYTPRRVVATHQTTTLDTLANRRVVWLAGQFASLLAELHGRLTGPEAERAKIWSAQVARVLRPSVFAALLLKASSRAPVGFRAVAETLDTRYMTTYDGVARLSELIGWSAQRERRPVYTYVDVADQIYQAFVVHALAEALGLDPTGRALGLTQPAFTGEQWDLYYNVVPPPAAMRSWRSFSTAHDGFRPDVLLVARDDGAVVVADAKYRNDGSRASESGRKEVMAYMAAFDIQRVLILYPPDPPELLAVHSVAGSGYEIIEVTVAPVPGLDSFLRAELAAVLARSRQPPTWRDA